MFRLKYVILFWKWIIASLLWLPAWILFSVFWPSSLLFLNMFLLCRYNRQFPRNCTVELLLQVAVQTNTRTIEPWERLPADWWKKWNVSAVNLCLRPPLFTLFVLFVSSKFTCSLTDVASVKIWHWRWSNSLSYRLLHTVAYFRIALVRNINLTKFQLIDAGHLLSWDFGFMQNTKKTDDSLSFASFQRTNHLLHNFFEGTPQV